MSHFKLPATAYLLPLIVLWPVGYLQGIIDFLRYGDCDRELHGHTCQANGTCCRRGQ